MSYEWHTEYALPLKDWETLENQARAELAHAGESPPTREKIARKAGALAHTYLEKFVADCPDAYASVQLLSQVVGNDDPKGRWAVQAKEVYVRRLAAAAKETAPLRNLMRALGLETPAFRVEDLAVLPEYSFFLYLPFTLAAPYLSKDDAPLYVHDNPVRKDFAFRVPLVSPAGWKGTLRAALRYVLTTDDADAQIVRLCGNAKGAEKEFRRGRLTFFTTFFDQIAVDVINPHDRHTSAGSQPIQLEQVPVGAQGVLALLYTPLPDAVVKEAERRYSPHQLARADAALTLRAVHFMLLESGFGAKTAAGMGRAASRLPAPGYVILPLKKSAGQPTEPFLLDALSILPALGERLMPALKKGASHG